MQILKTLPGFHLVTQVSLEEFLHPKCAVTMQTSVDLSGTVTKQALSDLLKRVWRAGCQNHVHMVGHYHKTQQPDLLLLQKPKESRRDFLGNIRLGQIHSDISAPFLGDEISMLGNINTMFPQVS